VTVLVVDCDAAGRQLLAEALRREGACVRECACFVYALGTPAPDGAVYAAAPAECLPDPEPLLRLLAQPGWSGVRGVLLTAAAGGRLEEARRRAAAGGVAVVRKPAAAAEVLAALAGGGP
jgi:CheY-like chemotaxis protein